MSDSTISEGRAAGGMARLMGIMPRLVKFATFAATGFFSSGVLLWTTWTLHEGAGLSPYVAAIAGYLVALLTGYVANARLTFKVGPSPKGLVAFTAINGFFRLGEYAIAAALMALGSYYLVAMLGVAVVSTFVKFFAYDKLAFRTKPAMG